MKNDVTETVQKIETEATPKAGPKGIVPQFPTLESSDRKSLSENTREKLNEPIKETAETAQLFIGLVAKFKKKTGVKTLDGLDKRTIRRLWGPFCELVLELKSMSTSEEKFKSLFLSFCKVAKQMNFPVRKFLQFSVLRIFKLDSGGDGNEEKFVRSALRLTEGEFKKVKDSIFDEKFDHKQDEAVVKLLRKKFFRNTERKKILTFLQTLRGLISYRDAGKEGMKEEQFATLFHNINLKDTENLVAFLCGTRDFDGTEEEKKAA